MDKQPKIMLSNKFKQGKVLILGYKQAVELVKKWCSNKRCWQKVCILWIEASLSAAIFEKASMGCHKGELHTLTLEMDKGLAI